LRVTATVAGDQGVVYLTKGAATRLADYANLVTDATSGAVSSAQQKLGEDLKALQEREDRVNAAVAQAQERYQRQFAQLEATLARLQTQSDRLTQQLESFTLGQQRYGTR
jgi:flagellar capping protein FliD